MKKRIVFFSVLAFIIIIIGALVFVNINNIKGIYEATKYSTEEIEKRMEESEEKQKEILHKYNQQNIKPLSEEDAKKLAEGELSEQDAIEIIMDKKDSETIESVDKDKNSDINTESKKPQQKPKEEVSNNIPTTDAKTDNEEAEIDEKIGELVAKIYVLKAKYNNLISAENYNVAKDFYSLPKEEQTRERKYQMGLTFMNTLKGYQSQCDAEINGVLSELTKLLKDNNMSTDLVDEIKKSYEEEKKNKIAYFVSKYTAKESRVVNEVN